GLGGVAGAPPPSSARAGADRRRRSRGSRDAAPHADSPAAPRRSRSRPRRSRAAHPPWRADRLLLRKLPVELHRIGGHPDTAWRELVEILRLPVEETLLLELLHVRRQGLVVSPSRPGRASRACRYGVSGA